MARAGGALSRLATRVCRLRHDLMEQVLLSHTLDAARSY